MLGEDLVGGVGAQIAYTWEAAEPLPDRGGVREAVRKRLGFPQ